ncbi:MAG: 50S ribosomal protein L24 [Candidatus Magasanikbacteria bacterium]|nr:50S ribosomal protein L24 [Candidatus Magasanikbacteria bacterium]
MRIKTGDNVRVVAGKDRGKEGKVIQAFPRDGKIVVEKVNVLKKHIRSRKQGEPGQRIELSAPISVSQVQLLCGSCGRMTRVGATGSGADKRRVCKKCKKEI